MSSANRHYILNDKNQILAADENGVPQSETPVDNNATVHLETPPPQQADQANVYFTNAGKNNAYNAAGAAFFNDKQPTYETYEAYLKAQSSAQAAHNHAQQQQQKQQQQQQHAHQQHQAQRQHHHVPTPHHHHASTPQHHHHQQHQQHHAVHPAAPAPQPQVQAAPQSKGGCTACKDCPNKVLPATITFVNHVPETPIYPESQLKEAADSSLVKHYYYAQPPPVHTSAAPTPASHQNTPQPTTPHHHQQQHQHHQQHQAHHQAQHQAHHQHQQQVAAPVVTKVLKTKQIATVAPPPPQAAAPAHHAHAAQPQQVYYHPIPHPPAHKHQPIPAPPAHAAPAAKPCTACKQQPAPQQAAPQAKVSAPIYYAHNKPAAYYSTLPSSVSKQAHPLAQYVPAPIAAPVHHQPAQPSSKQQIIRQKSSGNLLRHQPLAYVAPAADKHSHHHYQHAPAHHHHQKPIQDPSPAPKSNCTSCNQSAHPPSRASGSLNRAETVGCLPCMQKKLQLEAQIRAQIEAQEAADLAAKIRSLQTSSNLVKIQQPQKA